MYSLAALLAPARRFACAEFHKRLRANAEKSKIQIAWLFRKRVAGLRTNSNLYHPPANSDNF
jgi:hypothetical protein